MCGVYLVPYTNQKKKKSYISFFTRLYLTNIEYYFNQTNMIQTNKVYLLFLKI